MKKTISIFSVIIALGMLCTAFSSCEKNPSGSEDKVPGEIFTTWPGYSPTIHYSFLEDPSGVEMPVRDLPYKGKTKWVQSDRWWSFFVGPNANSLVRKEAGEVMLDKLNSDFSYIRDNMGWPPDLAPQKGYRSAVFLFGSGLSTDNASNTEKGGWQSAVRIGSTDYPIILLSYYPVYCFDPACTYADSDRSYQTEAVTHEGIHAVFASLPGCRSAAWFHEGSNCWLQATFNYEREHGENYEATSFGWLCMGSILAPFCPIECYSGWLTDGSFGGPSAQGVNQNFREIIGGMQYSEVFPTFLGEIVGRGSVPWVWINCKGRVLEGISKQLGDDQTKRLIQEYRARLCLSDLGKYTKAVQNMYKTYMGTIIGSDVEGVDVQAWKATPYVSTVPDEETGLLVPEERTLPGWSGANIVPILVESDQLTVSFQPIGENMSCQLCYRTPDGTTVYGEPFYEGDFTMRFDEYAPANSVVFAVVCNLDYIYKNDATRKAKFDYRLGLSEGSRTANIYKNWFDWTK